MRGSVCTHVSPHVAHVCATLRLAVPRQGHDADADADGHARNAVAAFIELAPDFLWAILLSLSLSLAVLPSPFSARSAIVTAEGC